MVAEKPASIIPAREGAAGTLPNEIYDGTLNWFRAGVRRTLVKSVQKESVWLAALQNKCRNPLLDSYFVYTSSLGTHTFFMTALPLLFFFGHFEVGRAFIFVLAAGVYVTSFIKDLLCSPRPFIPPVTRLSMGNHHLEYGFPSTHTTNSISIALYILFLLLNSPVASQPSIFIPSCIALGIYAASIVFGRLYCGMHSFTDCVAGIVIGSAIAVFWWCFGSTIENLVSSGDWKAPIAIIAVWMLIINQHPQPVDDCPCFEDAIAFVSVQAGSMLSIWHARQFKMDMASGFYIVISPGTFGNSTSDWTVWTLFACLKITLGIITVFAFRMLAKPTLQFLLPPVFRFLAQIFTLPNRRWYTPATEYESVPQDNLIGLRAIPSVIDLPSVLANGHGDSNHLSPYNFRRAAAEGLKKRRREESSEEKVIPSTPEPESTEDGTSKVRHYDADVITRAVVYSGIALLVTEFIPVCFELVGWGL